MSAPRASGTARKRGRPPSSTVVTGKDRTRAYRARKALDESSRIDRLAHLSNVELARFGAWVDQYGHEERREFWLEFGRRNGFR